MNRRSFLTVALASAGPLPFMGQAARAQTDHGVGVIFIGASWCPACKSAAPVLAAVAGSVGVPVLVASHDGRPIAPFSEFMDAREHPVASKIQRVPHTLIYSSVSDSIEAEIAGYKNAGHYGKKIQSAIVSVARRAG